MTPSLRDSVPIISNPGNLDESIQEVFQTMLSVHCERDGGSREVNVASASELVTAVVGFGGLLSGAYVIKCDSTTALRMAELMTGMQFKDVDETVKDGIGEICNMLAGSWKGKVPELSAHCGLSVPAIITGRDYELHVQAPKFQLEHVYSFEDFRFSVKVVCDGLK